MWPSACTLMTVRNVLVARDRNPAQAPRKFVSSRNREIQQTPPASTLVVSGYSVPSLALSLTHSDLSLY